MIIKLENTTTHQTYEYEVVDANNGEKLYFRFDINTADLDEGEYKLDLYDGDEHIATDLLKIGDFNTDTLQYKKGDNTYIAVTLDPNVQNKKQVEIDSINATVSPDVGYTSMAQVAIDAQPLYNTAYNEGYVVGEAVSYVDGYNNGLKDGEEIGYSKGFEGGIEEQKNQLISMTITENGTYNREDGYNEVIVNVPDINGSYDEGFTDGVTTQKSKLTSISITENGTYEKEDGYNKIVVEIEDTNGSYDEGFADGVEEGVEQAGEIIAETAQVLDITENGEYLSKYADTEYIYPDNITGVFDDGTSFYDWADIKNGCYNTDIPYTEGMVIEMWFNPLLPNNTNSILGCGKTTAKEFKIYYSVDKKAIVIKKNTTVYTQIPFIEESWNHIKIETNGLVYMNGVDVGLDLSQKTVNSDNSPFLINSTPQYSTKCGNGLFGMVKLNDTIFIPKDGGFINFNTGEKLGGYDSSLSNDATYEYAEGEEVTGYFDDGTPFYGYGNLYNAYFITKVKPTQNTKVEVWYKPLLTNNEEWEIIVGSQIKDDSSDTFLMRMNVGTLYFQLNDVSTSNSTNDYNADGWNHLVMSYNEGYFVNGEKKGDFTKNCTVAENAPFYINGTQSHVPLRTADGLFGMVKIDDHIFVPTPNGFIEYNTGDLLTTNAIIDGRKPSFMGEYYFTENKVITIEGEGNLIKKVSVNVIPKINIADIGLKFGYSNITEVPEWAVFDGIKSVEYMFYSCTKLTAIPQINTSNITNMNNMFYSCSSLVTIPLLDTSNVTNMYNMFYNCRSLVTIPLLDTSNVTEMNSLFEGCNLLVSIPQLNTKSAKNMRRMFYDCYALTAIPPLDARSMERQSNGIFGYSELSNLTDFGGLIGLKASMDGTYGFEKVPNLSYQSCINILNGLYDFTGNGETPSSSQGKLKVHSNFLTLVGDEISIGVAKGWIISA